MSTSVEAANTIESAGSIDKRRPRTRWPNGSKRAGPSEGAAEPASARVRRLRHACLRALARLEGRPEPTLEECERASWVSGLQGAYRSVAGGSRAKQRDLDAISPTHRQRYVWAATLAASLLLAELVFLPPAAFWEAKGHLPPERVLGVPNAPVSPLLLLAARGWSALLAPLGFSADTLLTVLSLIVGAGLSIPLFLIAHHGLWRLTHAARGPAAAGRLALAAALCVALVGWGLTVFTLDPARGGGYALNAGALYGAVWLVWRRRGIPSASAQPRPSPT